MFGANATATPQGSLLQLRALDWNVDGQFCNIYYKSSPHTGILFTYYSFDQFPKMYLLLGLDKICFFSFLFCFSFMLDKSTYFAFPIHPFCIPKIPFLHIVIKVQAKIRESNEQGCIAT